MRDSCLSCVRKHLAQAIVLMAEADMGYPLHKWLAIGHMAEAADECVANYPEFANTIRKTRIEYEEGAVVDLVSLIEATLTIEPTRGEVEE